MFLAKTREHMVAADAGRHSKALYISCCWFTSRALNEEVLHVDHSLKGNWLCLVIENPSGQFSPPAGWWVLMPGTVMWQSGVLSAKCSVADGSFGVQYVCIPCRERVCIDSVSAYSIRVCVLHVYMLACGVLRWCGWRCFILVNPSAFNGTVMWSALTLQKNNIIILDT